MLEVVILVLIVMILIWMFSNVAGWSGNNITTVVMAVLIVLLVLWLTGHYSTRY